MRKGGNESWRFAHDIDQVLHVLLYVRDALRLEVHHGQGVPPPLAGGVTDRTELLDAAARQEATRDWPPWWQAVVAELARTELGPGPSNVGEDEWVRERALRHRLAVDHPEWSSLAGHRALQTAARALWGDGCRWLTALRQSYLPPARQDVFAWELVRDAAERAVAGYQMSLGTVNGAALVLMVEGAWWELFSPGVVLCSVSAATIPETTAAILAEVFDSYLGTSSS